MAAAAEDSSVVIQLEDDEVGERIGSDDYFFIPVGEPVPIKPGDDSEFDVQNLPSQPLSVSEQFGLVFVAHSTGFCVARTKDVLESAKVIEEKGSGPSIKELSVVEVPIGKVHILALSADSSTLAACIDGNIHFFSVPSLLNKEQSPSFSCSLNVPSCVKDMRWNKKLENLYVVLSNHGDLYYGASRDPLTSVMDNVDAVDWNVKGDFVAVARKNTISIMSSKFEQKFSMSLSFESWLCDSDLDCTVKVDSIRWVRPDAIIIGCFQLTSDGKEENYLVEVITSKDGKITDASSKPIVLSFSDVFEGFIDEIVPFGGGPYMSLSYLNTCELAITANRKSTDQHIVLFGWSLNDKKEAAVIDILRDTLCPKIPLQGNGDDNMVLGLCVDRISQNEKVEVKLGAEYKELSPFCILLCLSFDGKLFMFQVASVTGVSVPSDDVSLLSDNKNETPKLVSSEDGKSNASSGLVVKGVEVGLGFQSQEVNKKEHDGILVTNEPMLPFAKDFLTTTTSADGMSLKETIAAKVLTTSVNSETIETYGKQKFLVNKLNQDTDGQQSRLSGQQGTGLGHSSLKTPYLEGPGPVVRDFNKAETRKLPEDESSAVSSPGKFLADVSSQSIPITVPRAVELGKDLTDKFGLASSKVSPSNPSSNGIHIFPITSDGGSSLKAPSYFQSNQSGNSNTKSSIAQFPVGPFGNFSHAKQASGQSSAFYSSETTAYSGGHGTSTTAGIAEPLPAIRSSQISSQQNFTSGKSSKDKSQPNKENYRAASPTRLLNSEPHLSKQFGNVEEMIKELETLLGCIEGAGGFLDACTVLHESSVFEVEEGIGTLFNRCRLWKSIMYERLGEIQLILDNTVQVLARKTYMEGIVKQATDGQYWDLWNRQKLSSELELKQQHISKVNQELTNQLIELERHLNTLELNKFGENDDVRMSQRAFPGRFGPSRHVQSLHTLRSTMSSQLAAAEQLSECLSKQMAVLSIEPPSVKKQNVRKELFEAIGIPYNTASFSSPDEKIAGNTHSNNKLLMSSCSDAVKGQSSRNQSSAMRGCESETARRRRDSLDQSWASFEPRKTMVKRMLLHEDRPKASTDRSALLDKKHVKSPTLEGSEVVHTERLTATSTLFYPSDEKGIQDRMTKQASEIPSTSCQWFDEPSGSSQSMGLKSSPTQISPVNNFSAFSSHSAYMSSTIASQNNVRGSFNPTANLSSSGVTIVEKPDSLSVNDSKFIQKSKSELHLTPSISKRLPGQTLSLLKKPSETSNSSDKETNLVKSTIGNGNHQPSSTKSSFLGSGKGLESPFYHASVSNPAPNLNADVFQSDSAASKTQSSRIASSSTFLLSSSSSPSSPLVHSSLLLPSSLPTPTEETSSPAISMGRSLTNFKASINDSQTTLISQSSGSSPIVSSDSSYQVPEKTVPTATPIPSMTLEPESPKRALQPSIGKLSSTTDENARLQGSSRKTEPAEPSANLQSGSKLSFNGMGTPGMNAALNSKPVLPFRTDVLSAAVLSTSGSASGGKSEVADVAVTQEDEMEEEAPETSQTTELSLGSLGSFGIGSSPNPTPAKANPFGATFVSAESTPASSPFNLTVPTGELFRPASFSFQSPQPFQPSQVPNFGAFSGGFNTGTTPQVPAGSGFGQPAQVGSGQQALGSVLGAFGQSRQLGGVLPGTSASSASGFSAGLISSPSTGGFASTGGGFGSLASASGGFAGAASAGGGFAAAASAGGGFGGIASAGGGFGGIASAGGGFAAPASAGGGFAGAASGSGFPSSGGGFGAFNNQQGSGGFSAFSSSAGGTGRPPSVLFTQMRK